MHNSMNCLLPDSIFLFYLNIFKFIDCFNFILTSMLVLICKIIYFHCFDRIQLYT